MGTSPEDRRRARAVAAVACRLAADAGRDLPEGLLIWRLAGGTPGVPDEVTGGGADLAQALESATSDERRRRSGLHVTPRWLADELVGLGLEGVWPAGGGGRTGGGADCGALTDPGGPGGTATAEGTTLRPVAVCDPACGGGAFLVAAARALAARGLPRAEIVRRALWGADIDPVGLAAAEAALAAWAGEAPPPGRLVVADPLRSGATWPDAPGAGFDLVVGNPPFQSQLDRATARGAADRAALRARFGKAVRAYTDTAWLFLLLACDLAAPGGRVVLVQPQSLVAARDAAAVRRALEGRTRLHSLWVERRPVFGTAVRVCAPVVDLVESAGSTPVGPNGARCTRAPGPDGAVAAPGGEAPAPQPVDDAPPVEDAPPVGDAPPVEDAWREGLAEALGLPRVRATIAGRLGDRVRVVAGFRDEYYGLVHVVREATTGELGDLAGAPSAARSPGGAAAALVTSGAIGWARTTWGDVPVRYARRRWAAPVVDLGAVARLGDRASCRWVARTAGAKVLVASQTRIVEAVVDEAGRWVPSIPVIALVPHDPDDVWLVAAAVLAPAATAWLARRAPGTALARDAIKVAAPDLAALPLPSDVDAWREAAAVLRRVSDAWTPCPTAPAVTVPSLRREDGGALTDHFADLAAAAYGLGDAEDVGTWWRGRLPAGAADGAPSARGSGRRAGATG